MLPANKWKKIHKVAAEKMANRNSEVKEGAPESVMGENCAYGRQLCVMLEFHYESFSEKTKFLKNTKLMVMVVSRQQAHARR